VPLHIGFAIGSQGFSTPDDPIKGCPNGRVLAIKCRGRRGDRFKLIGFEFRSEKMPIRGVSVLRVQAPDMRNTAMTNRVKIAAGTMVKIHGIPFWLAEPVTGVTNTENHKLALSQDEQASSNPCHTTGVLSAETNSRSLLPM
jgi:hypothetical protein